MVENIYKFYEENLGGYDFYSSLKNKRDLTPELYNRLILIPDEIGYPISEIKSKSVNKLDEVYVQHGDLRIDMPILIGSTQPKVRILILGLEPRHTDDFYNVLKKDKTVYATPFGIDRWFAGVKQNIYASAFHKYLAPDRLFLFSDFVKQYEVIDPNNKNKNGNNARDRFKHLFESKYQNILTEEIKLFAPHIIIGMGKIDISNKVPKDFIKDNKINIICHPTRGNYPRMIKGMDEIFNSLTS
jgi:hypothetical protein